MSDDEPICEVEYKAEGGRLCPILEIKLGKDKKVISAYADTGCDTGITLFKEQIEDIDMGKKISSSPSPSILADGRVIGADEYLTIAYINGEKIEIVISVIDREKDLGYVEIEKMMPLLGRNFLDRFDVLFRGKSKKIVLYRC